MTNTHCVYALCGSVRISPLDSNHVSDGLSLSLVTSPPPGGLDDPHQSRAQQQPRPKEKRPCRHGDRKQGGGKLYCNWIGHNVTARDLLDPQFSQLLQNWLKLSSCSSGSFFHHPVLQCPVRTHARTCNQLAYIQRGRPEVAYTHERRGGGGGCVDGRAASTASLRRLCGGRLRGRGVMEKAYYTHTHSLTVECIRPPTTTTPREQRSRNPPFSSEGSQ